MRASDALGHQNAADSTYSNQETNDSCVRMLPNVRNVHNDSFLTVYYRLIKKVMVPPMIVPMNVKAEAIPAR